MFGIVKSEHQNAVERLERRECPSARQVSRAESTEVGMAMTKIEMEWIPLAESAKLAGVGRTSLHEAAARGEIGFVWTRLGRLFFVDDIERWREEREHGNRNEETT